MSGFKNILALDTALNNCSAGIFASGKIISETKEMMQGHAEHLLPMTGRVLRQADLRYDDLYAVVTTLGPGAFTGLRIGLSTARALALALDIPLFGITTMQILALQAVKVKAEKTLVVLETKRQDFYVQAFDAKGNSISEAACLQADEIKTDGFVLVGDGVVRLTGKAASIIAPDIGMIAGLLVTNPEYFTEGAEPVYLRGADVTASKRENRIFEGSGSLK
jgi:tRNA threonylcarbamoyladenosine biosynthesis protein TsaB